MFTMMNHARLDVALQGAANAQRARDIAAAMLASAATAGSAGAATR